jgi:RNA polymerase sigma factor (sigma-70 family)
MVAATPFAEPPDEEIDLALVARAQRGDRDASSELATRHYRWILNVAIRMVHARADAEDVTHEALVKVLGSLGSFRGESAFRTWVYRIVKNLVIDRRRRASLEEAGLGFDGVRRDLESTPDGAPPDAPAAEAALLVEEARVGCTTAMLMCLDRRQRLTFILGECLGVSDRVGAEILETSPENFRQLLTRARRDLYQFMNGQCGLVNEANPCRCAKKTRGFIAKGWVDPKSLQFVGPRLVQIRAVAPSRLDELDELDRRHAEVFRGDSFVAPADEAVSLQRLLSDPRLRPLIAPDE